MGDSNPVPLRHTEPGLRQEGCEGGVQEGEEPCAQGREEAYKEKNSSLEVRAAQRHMQDSTLPMTKEVEGQCELSIKSRESLAPLGETSNP